MLDAMQTSGTANDSTWSLLGACDEGGPVRKVGIAGSETVIGRWDNVDVRLDFRGVSKRHACLKVVDGKLLIQDLESTNGTFVNGQRISQETPVEPNDVVQFGNAPFQVFYEQAARPEHTQAEVIVDSAMMLLQFDRLMCDRSVTPFFQPIIDYSNDSVIAYEVLARSRIVSLESAKSLFDAAALVQQEAELSRMMRDEGSRVGYAGGNIPALFVNMHPAELNEDQLVSSLGKLRIAYPDRPLTLEIHESTVTDVQQMRDLHAELKAMNIQLAYDDFGAGQARLLELVEVPPDYLKFDRQLIASIHEASPQRQKMLETLVHMVCDLGITPLAEGVECEGEDKICRQLGFELGQGYLYGRPEPAAHWLQDTPSISQPENPPITGGSE